MKFFSEFREWYEVDGRRFSQSVAKKTFGRTGISPNYLTVSGSLLNLVAAILIVSDHWFSAATIFLIGSLLDSLDGAVAKVTGKETKFGAFLDSTLDRVSEGFVIAALGIVFAHADNLIAVGACFVALASSYLVSYTRARAESLNVQCKGGLASRTERVFLITVGLLLTGLGVEHAIDVVIYMLASAAALTVIQRVVHVRKVLNERDRKRAEREKKYGSRPRRRQQRRRNQNGRSQDQGNRQ